MVTLLYSHGHPSQHSWSHFSALMVTLLCTHGHPSLHSWSPFSALMVTLLYTHGHPSLHSWSLFSALMVLLTIVCLFCIQILSSFFMKHPYIIHTNQSVQVLCLKLIYQVFVKCTISSREHISACACHYLPQCTFCTCKSIEINQSIKGAICRSTFQTLATKHVHVPSIECSRGT